MPDEGFTDLAATRVALRRFDPRDLEAFVAYRSSAGWLDSRTGTRPIRMRRVNALSGR
jgi:hypothetical protein